MLRVNPQVQNIVAVGRSYTGASPLSGVFWQCHRGRRGDRDACFLDGPAGLVDRLPRHHAGRAALCAHELVHAVQAVAHDVDVVDVEERQRGVAVLVGADVLVAAFAACEKSFFVFGRISGAPFRAGVARGPLLIAPTAAIA